MKIKLERRLGLVTLTLILIFILLTAGSPKPLLPPGVIPEPERTLEDVNANLKAKEHRVLSGDTFTKNIYERPFTSGEMIYQPDVNIRIAYLASDDIFIYFTIELEGLDAVSHSLTATYGIEFDRTKTGQGDMLVWVHDLKKDWSMDNLKVFIDPDKSVGGPSPMLADEGYTGNGYESEIKMEGDKTAFARVAPDDPTQVQIAVSRMLLDNAKEFLWGAWADKGLRDPMRFDYNDHFGLSAAGSPIKSDKTYPIKDLFSLDNTCRMPYGFTTKNDIRGMCNSVVCKTTTSCNNRNKTCTTRTICS
jgi:hypothetical protein